MIDSRRCAVLFALGWLGIVGCETSSDPGPAGSNPTGDASESTDGNHVGSEGGDGGGGDSGGGGGKEGGSDATSGGDGGAPFTFLVYGDSRSDGSDCNGNQNHIRVVTQMAKETGSSLTMHVGDIITGYASRTCFTSNGDCTAPGQEGNVKSIIAPLQNRAPAPGLPVSFFPVIGNHDDNRGSGWYPDPCSGAQICDLFDLKKIITRPLPSNDPCGADYPDRAYYSFRHGGALFVVLHVNSDDFSFFECNGAPSPFQGCDDYCKNGPQDAVRTDRCYLVHQYDWLKSELAAADADPTVKHKFVFLHAPVYTSFEDHAPVVASPQLKELYDQFHVTMQFNGHNHTYERTFAIRAGAKAAGGTVYVTTSGGGVEMYSPRGDWFTAASAGVNHYMRVRVSTDVHVDAVDATGNVFDSF